LFPPRSAGLREEPIHIGGELAVVLDEEAMGRVRVDLQTASRVTAPLGGEIVDQGGIPVVEIAAANLTRTPSATRK